MLTINSLKISIVRALLLLAGNLVLIASQDYEQHSHSPHGIGPCLPNANGGKTYTHKIGLQHFPKVVGAKTYCKNNVAASFPCRNIDLESFLPPNELTGTGRGENLNDIWGWTDPNSGVDYAIVGMYSGTAFVELTDPTNPKLVGFLDTHSVGSDWRDAKTYKNHVFIISEAEEHGMQIFDLTQLSSLSSFTKLTETAHYVGGNGKLGRAHNVFINEDSGFAYVVGATKDFCSSGGLHIVDVRDPANPVSAGCYWEEFYTHDVQCVNYDGPDVSYSGKEICFASNEDRVVIVDVTDKSNMKRLSTLYYDNEGYTHQGWLTEDHRYFLIDDETDEFYGGIRTRTIIADVSDLDDPKVIGEHKANNRAIDHNLYVKGNLVYQANYQAGLRVLDLTDVVNGNLVEKAYFDVYPQSNDNYFNGAWSNYPFFESGIVVVSGIEQGLFVVTVDMNFPDEGDGNNGNDGDDNSNGDDGGIGDDVGIGDDLFDFDDGFDYSNCTVPFPNWIKDGLCDGGEYDTPECNYDGGDCERSADDDDGGDGDDSNTTSSPTTDSSTTEPTSSPTTEPTSSPNKSTSSPTTDSSTTEPTFSPTAEPTSSPGDSTSSPTTDSSTTEPTSSPTAEPTSSVTSEPTSGNNGGGGNNDVFPNDGFDYSNCKVSFPHWIADGYCDGMEYNTAGCNWDGGDCNQTPDDGFDYSNCAVAFPSWIGDGECDGDEYNVAECNNDGGDCDSTGDTPFPRDGFDYSNCNVNFPSWIGDGECDGNVYNVAECNNDGGDCDRRMLSILGSFFGV